MKHTFVLLLLHCMCKRARFVVLLHEFINLWFLSCLYIFLLRLGHESIAYPLKQNYLKTPQTELTWTMMCLQTGVNPEHLQAARKALRKQREKANGNQNPPLKMCAKVSLASPPARLCKQSALLTVQTCFVSLEPDLTDNFLRPHRCLKAIIKFVRSPVRG